jgi:hypothetical protein
VSRAWRIGSVFAPPLIAGLYAFRTGGDNQLDVVGALVLLWLVMSATPAIPRVLCSLMLLARTSAICAEK